MDKAIEMYQKSFAIADDMGDKQDMANDYTNLAGKTDREDPRI